MRQCYIRRHSPGGDDNLGIIVKSFKPKVECYSRLEKNFQKSCKGLADHMATTLYKTTFGYAWTNPQYRSPYEWRSPDRLSS